MKTSAEPDFHLRDLTTHPRVQILPALTDINLSGKQTHSRLSLTDNFVELNFSASVSL